MNTKKILLLGGSGIISSKVCEKAIENQYEVTIMNRGRRKAFCNKNAKLIISDLRKESKEELAEKVQDMKFDVVIDFISYKDYELKKYIDVFSKLCKQYIFISSATIYRDMGQTHIYTENDPIDNDLWSYCVEKAKCEQLLAQLAKQRGFEYTIIRSYVTYGITRLPYQIAPLKYYTIIDRILNHQPIPICGADTQCTVTSADDFAVGVVGLILNKNAYNEAFHITSEHTTSWKHIIELTAEKLNRNVQFIDFQKSFLKKYCNKGIDTDEILADKSRNMIFDNSKIKKAVPQFTGETTIDEMLDAILDYYKQPEHCEVDYFWNGCVDRYIKKYDRTFSLSTIRNPQYILGKNALLFHLYLIAKRLYKFIRQPKKTSSSQGQNIEVKCKNTLPPIFEHMEQEACMGCEACANVCPKNIIVMKPDETGYALPCLEPKDHCIHCNLCTKVCPALGTLEKKEFRTEYYGASSKNRETILQSSSGGIFSELVRIFHENHPNGTLAGAIYEDDFKSVKHVLTDDAAVIEKMRGSKYVQSKKGSIYTQIKEELESGGSVFFTGTPCEAAALKQYLGKEYENLFVVDFICKGGASPKTLKDYITHIEKKKKADAIGVNMRYKWEKLDIWIPQFIRIDFSNGKKLIKEFYNTELGHAFKILQRSACYSCKYRETGYQSDITIGDYHGVSKEAKCYNRLGTSVILINTPKGNAIFNQMKEQLIIEPLTFEQTFGNNRNTKHPQREPLALKLQSSNTIDAVHDVLSKKDKLKMVLPVKMIRTATRIWRKIKR